MKKSIKILGLFLIALTLLITSSFAIYIEGEEPTVSENGIMTMSAEFENIDSAIDAINSDNVNILSSNFINGTVNSDLYLNDEEIIVEQNVNGNVYLIGDTINISSTEINGNVFVIGKSVIINSNINGSVYSIADSMEISGKMNDIYTITSNLNLLENTNCRDIKTIGNNISIAGNIERDVYAIGENLEIKDTENANIGGTLYFPNEIIGNKDKVNNFEIIEDVNINLEETESELEEVGKVISKAITTFFFFSSLIIGLVIIAIIVAITSKDNINNSDLKEKFISDTVWGLVYFGIAIAIILGLILTILGIPVSIFLALALWIICWKITIPVATIQIAKAIIKSEEKSKIKVWFLAFIIFVITQAMVFIPTVGEIIKFVISLYGFGYMCRTLFKKDKETGGVEILA